MYIGWHVIIKPVLYNGLLAYSNPDCSALIGKSRLCYLHTASLNDNPPPPLARNDVATLRLNSIHRFLCVPAFCVLALYV